MSSRRLSSHRCGVILPVKVGLATKSCSTTKHQKNNQSSMLDLTAIVYYIENIQSIFLRWLNLVQLQITLQGLAKCDCVTGLNDLTGELTSQFKRQLPLSLFSHTPIPLFVIIFLQQRWSSY